MCQLWHYRWVGASKYCIGLYQSFQILALCLHELYGGVYVIYCLMIWLWRGRQYTIYVLHCHNVTSFSCGCYHSSLLSMCSVEEHLVVCPRLLVSGMTSPLSDVFVENTCLCQKYDPFEHHHSVGDRLPSWSHKLSPLLQLFYQLGNGFRGVVGPYHLHCILLEVDFVYHPVAWEKVLNYGECGHIYEPC